MIFSPLISWVTLLLSNLPTLTISIDSSVFEVVYGILGVVCYLIPVWALVPILEFSILVVMFKIGCNCLRFVGSFF